ncbi:MFS transporter [Pseudoalteromonas sp. MM1]|uniref:2-dehydro-3-deoxygalactonokinase n=1 Tax=Pseudoalteromonas sp. MM1 TaxID=3036714 RepID=UPI00257441C0|nr:2-dehydro-3-deoxygalactonokinase [Pseudoalteromonas sp. MM1]BED89365.1 MFS transporter [Pseudoalteromonas sp. MM1]
MDSGVDKISYCIVDWGSSNFRIFLMDHNDKLLAKKESEMGLLKIEGKDFPTALESVLKLWVPCYQQVPIFMAGMVGSFNGWHNVDYVETPVDKTKLANGCFKFNLPWLATAAIIPGILHTAHEQNYNDVMRGEEVQVFGLMDKCNRNSFKAILPGTHSKHVSVINNEICSLSSFMTGELFAVISQHTILGKKLPDQVFNEHSFRLGVAEGVTNQLTHVLFRARTHMLFNTINPEHVESYLSGLLIGNELQAVSKDFLFIVGNESLCRRYLIACKVLGIKAEHVSGDECFLLGMIKLKNFKLPTSISFS